MCFENRGSWARVSHNNHITFMDKILLTVSKKVSFFLTELLLEVDNIC
jgi:hypothetical protein